MAAVVAPTGAVHVAAKRARTASSTLCTDAPRQVGVPRECKVDMIAVLRALDWAMSDAGMGNDAQQSLRRAINNRMRPHAELPLFCIDHDRGVECDVIDFVVHWRPPHPQVQLLLAKCLLAGGLGRDGQCVAFDATGKMKLLAKPAVEAVLAQHGGHLEQQGALTDVGTARAVQSATRMAVELLKYVVHWAANAMNSQQVNSTVEFVNACSSFRAADARGAGVVYRKEGAFYLKCALEEAVDRCQALVVMSTTTSAECA